MEYQDPEWIAALKTKHPLLFHNIAPYNFDVGPGWQGIVTEVCEALDSLGMADLTVFQIKQKFGGLRVYTEWDGDDLRPEVMGIIQQAEDRAWHVCEMCGGPAETDGWTTLCQSCRAGERIRFTLDAKKWEAFQNALEAPPRPMPRLKKLLTEPGFFDAEIPQGPQIRLSLEDQEAFAEGLLNPPPLTPSMLRALERLKAFRTPPSDDPEAQ